VFCLTVHRVPTPKVTDRSRPIGKNGVQERPRRASPSNRLPGRAFNLGRRAIATRDAGMRDFALFASFGDDRKRSRAPCGTDHCGGDWALGSTACLNHEAPACAASLSSLLAGSRTAELATNSGVCLLVRPARAAAGKQPPGPSRLKVRLQLPGFRRPAGQERPWTGRATRCCYGISQRRELEDRRRVHRDRERQELRSARA
jgi:hypothetical protein